MLVLPPWSRFARPLVLACALLATPTPSVSQARPLTMHVGDSVPYRIGLPASASISRDRGVLYAESEEVMVAVLVLDVVEGEPVPAPYSESEFRQALTDEVLGSDSLLFAWMAHTGRAFDRFRRRDVVQEIRTLRGQRAGYMRGRITGPRSVGWFESYFTVHNGVIYALMFVGAGGRTSGAETLVADIRESLAFADSGR